MSELRERLAEAIDRPLTAREAASGEWAASIRADAALSVFAEWLRERANEHHARGNWDSERHIDELADEIVPQP